jgi:hypothetical protein
MLDLSKPSSSISPSASSTIRLNSNSFNFHSIYPDKLDISNILYLSGNFKPDNTKKGRLPAWAGILPKEKRMANVISRRTDCWIQFQLKLSGFGHQEVADMANCSIYNVSHFLCGRKNSDRVRQAICKILGCEDFDKLVASSWRYIPAEGGAA